MSGPYQKKTKRRNCIVIVQTRDLDEIRPRIESALRRFDSALLEIMPGVWHIAPVAPVSKIRETTIYAVSDCYDDRVMVIDNPDGWATWDGGYGQHVRTEELKRRWVLTNDLKRGKSERWRKLNIPPAPTPDWVKEKRQTGTKISN
jgi:hypothetical protein